MLPRHSPNRCARSSSRSSPTTVRTGHRRTRRQVVRVVIDTHDGDGRVPIDECAAVSRELGELLRRRGRDAGRVHAGSLFAPGSTACSPAEKGFQRCLWPGSEDRRRAGRSTGAAVSAANSSPSRAVARRCASMAKPDRDPVRRECRRRTRSITSPSADFAKKSRNSGEAR